MHVLKGASAIVWQRLDGSSLDHLVERLGREFGLDSERAAADVAAAVEMLAAADLLDHEDLTHPPTG